MVTNHTAVISSSASNAPNVTRNAEHSGSMASSMSGSSLLVHLCKRFSQFHYQVHELSLLNVHLSTFNHVFASFLLSLQLASDGIHISGRPVSTSNCTYQYIHMRAYTIWDSMQRCMVVGVRICTFCVCVCTRSIWSGYLCAVF